MWGWFGWESGWHIRRSCCHRKLCGFREPRVEDGNDYFNVEFPIVPCEQRKPGGNFKIFDFVIKYNFEKLQKVVMSD